MIGNYVAAALLTGTLVVSLQAADTAPANWKERLNTTLVDDADKRAAYAKELLALPSADVPMKTEALKALVVLTDYGQQYVSYYLKLRPKQEAEKLEQDNRLYREELVRLNPSNATYRNELGHLYVQSGAADKATGEFRAVLLLPGLTTEQQGDALTGLASAALLKGDQPAAIRYCEDLVGRNLNTAGRYKLDPVAQAKYLLQFAPGRELDSLKLPFYTGAKAFPTPQQANYSETFVPLTAVKLVLGKDLKQDDMRLLLLKTKFGRFGIKFTENAPFTIKVNTEAEPKAPERPEGYALTVTKTGAVINSRDAQGTLWGIVSLIQLVDFEKTPKVRVAAIVDYPDTARRGFLQNHWKDALEYMLFCKMNTVVSQRGPQITVNDPFLQWTPLEKAICKVQSQTFTAFGLKMYYGIGPWTMFFKLPLSSERTFELHREICSEIAKNGGHVYFPYDDARFPVPQADLDKFGAAANMDAKYVTRLFQAVRKEHPGFQMVFCPPFYWGPDSVAAYPEPREPYLKSLGDYLDPDIDVFWTGPRVKGYEKTKEQVAWFVGLTKHKPMIFQNGTGPHNLLSYITDETPQWKTWHYDGFYENDIAGFLKNAGMGQEAPQTATLADCLWNVKAYDAAASARNAVAMLYGKDMFDILDPANKALAYLDKYRHGQVTPEAVTEIPEIERRGALAEAAYNKGLAYNGFSISNFPGSLGQAIGFTRSLADDAKKAPDFYKKYAKEIDETRVLAVKEVGLDAAKGDCFKSPVDLVGGRLMVYKNKCPPRFGNAIRGQGTSSPILKSQFTCDPFPPSGDYVLFLSAQDDEAEAACQIRIAVNGKPVFEGPNKFVHFGWSVEKFVIPFACLKRENVLTIENIEDSDNRTGPPWFMVNYAVIKKAAQ